MKGYKCTLPIDELLLLREDFWSFQRAHDNIWRDIRQAVAMDEYRSNIYLNNLKLTTVNACINHLIDKNGNKTQLKTYNAQGGFVGFVAPKGNYHYEMTYFTPYLKEGLIISITSFVLFVGTSTGIVIYNHSKKNKKEFKKT